MAPTKIAATRLIIISCSGFHLSMVRGAWIENCESPWRQARDNSRGPRLPQRNSPRSPRLPQRYSEDASLTVLLGSQPLEIIRSNRQSRDWSCYQNADYGDQPSELLSRHERQSAACCRYIHRPSHYAGWAVAVPRRLGAWCAAWLFLDWTFHRPCWRFVVCVGLVLSRPPKPAIRNWRH